ASTQARVDTLIAAHDILPNDDLALAAIYRQHGRRGVRQTLAFADSEPRSAGPRSVGLKGTLRAARGAV
ncbi:MAG: hypothetical protein ACKVP2_16105, partial [Burkholderiales bacterium]